jgi:hypothetical protein
MMIFLERCGDYISILCFVKRFQISKDASGKYQLVIIKTSGKHKLSIKFYL